MLNKLTANRPERDDMKEYTVKDYTTGKEYQYKTMNEAQAKQELLVFVYGHDAEVL